MSKNFKAIVEELFDEAQKGEVLIKTKDTPWHFFVKFNTRIEHKNMAKQESDVPVLEIPDYASFLEKLEEYVNVAAMFYGDEKDYLEIVSNSECAKKLILDLFVNCSPEDFFRIENFIALKTNMLKESQLLINSLGLNSKPLFSKYSLNKNNQTQGDLFLGTLNIANNNVSMFADFYKTFSGIEAPLVFLPYLKNETGEVFFLPGVLFGLNKNKQNNDQAFIGAVQNFSPNQDDRFSKNMDRFLRKVNSGLDLSSIESNVSPKAVVSMTLFMEYINSLGINNVYANNFAPLRYASKENRANFLKSSSKNLQNDSIFEKIDADQFNITNKFMYLFARMKYHFPEIDLSYSDFGCYLNLNLETKNNDNIIYDISHITQQELQNNKQL